MAQTAPGWYRNPSQQDVLLFWDGADWRTGPEAEVVISKQARFISFIPAIVMAFKRWNDFGGRSSASEYWWWRLFLYVVTFLPVKIVGSIDVGSVIACRNGEAPYLDCTVFTNHNPIYLLTLVLTVVFLVPDIAITMRRLHDIGKSGWWVIVFVVLPFLTVFVPFTVSYIGAVIVLVLAIMLWQFIWFIRTGQGIANRWGPVPQRPPGKAASQ